MCFNFLHLWTNTWNAAEQQSQHQRINTFQYVIHPMDKQQTSVDPNILSFSSSSD